MSGWPGFSTAAALCLLAYFVVVARWVSRVEAILLGGAAIVSAAVLGLSPEPLAVIGRGLAQGGAYVSLVLALSFVQAPAEGSRMVLRCGDYLVRQGPGRRYLALTAGAHLFGTVLNLGALALLGTMVQQSNTLAAAGGDARVRDIRARRMNLALLRGFGTTTLWSTGSIAPPVMLSLFPAVSWLELVCAGFLFALILMTVGFVLDRWQWPRAARVAMPAPAASADTAAGALLPMVALVAAIVSAIVAVRELIGWSLPTTIITTVPSAALVWLLCQRRGAASALRRMAEHAGTRLPRMRWEVISLGSAGVMGAGIAALVPPTAILALLETLSLPPSLLLVGISSVMLTLCMLGVNPVVSATILGASLGQLAGHSVPPLALILTLMGPWCLYAMCSPFAASVVMLARMADTTPGRMGRVWNGPFLLISFALAALCIVLLVQFGGPPAR